MMSRGKSSLSVLMNHTKYYHLHWKQLILSEGKNIEQCKHIHISAYNQMARRFKKEIAFQSELTNPVEVVFGGEKKAPDNVGIPFDKIPFKVKVEKYHLYNWCGCGRSHGQPYCDSTCKSQYLQKLIKGGPVKYIAPENRDVWFCMCKQVNISYKSVSRPLHFGFLINIILNLLQLPLGYLFYTIFRRAIDPFVMAVIEIQKSKK